MRADLIDLTQEVKAAVAQLDDVDQHLYMQPFANIEAMLAYMNLETSWQESKGRLDEATMVSLRFIADKLSRVSGVTPIKNEEIERLKAEVDKLIQAVTSSLQPDRLKASALAQFGSNARSAFGLSNSRS